MSQRWSILTGCVDVALPTLPDKHAQMCVTSPPYWGLRDYGCEGQLGLERTPEEYIARMVTVFREVRRVLRDDGTLFLNIGDCYAGSGRGGNPTEASSTLQGSNATQEASMVKRGFATPCGFKPKDLIGIPWMLAFALRADGWYLRSDIIWHKPNPMPSSVTDRPTTAHEYIFLLSKQARYYYDAEAIAEPCVAGDRGSSFVDERDLALHPSRGRSERKRSRMARPVGWATDGDYSAINHNQGERRKMPPIGGVKAVGENGNATYSGNTPEFKDTRNARDVWTIATQGTKYAHYATFPEELPRRCIKAGCPVGGVVLDPFSGTGTTGKVALELGRSYVGVELNPKDAEYSRDRLRKVAPLLAREEIFA